MTEIKYKIQKAYRDGGFSTLLVRSIRYIYRNTIQSRLPYLYGEYNGIKVQSVRLLDPFLEDNRRNRPEYEKGIVDCMEGKITEDDKIIIVGGGIGVTATKAAKLNSSPSNVTVYEGSKYQIRKMKKTFTKNNVTGIEIKNEIVGPEVDVWGDTNDIKKTKPSQLEECDVLELDCEGSEISIIENMEIRPREMIVETHGSKGAPTEKVREKLEELSYKIENIQLAEPNEICERNDIQVICATKN